MTSIVLNRPPNIRLTEGLRKYYTLHCADFVFTIQKNGTSVLSFRKKRDAAHFGLLLESHFDLTHTWPNINFEESLMFRSPRNTRLKYLNINEWREEDLRNFCIRNYMGMLDIYNIEEEYKLVGRSIYWEAPMNIYIETLNNRIKY